MNDDHEVMVPGTDEFDDAVVEVLAVITTLHAHDINEEAAKIEGYKAALAFVAEACYHESKITQSRKARDVFRIAGHHFGIEKEQMRNARNKQENE